MVLARILGTRPSDEKAEYSDPSWSIGDPALASLFADWLGIGSSTGLPSVSQADAFGLTSFSRGVELISGTLAGLPLKTYAKLGDSRTQVSSVFDSPQGPYAISTFQWVEMVFIHLVVWREAFLLHVRNDAGALVGFWPVHPEAVTKVEWVGPLKRFHVKDANGQETVYDSTEMTQILGPNAWGLRGIPLFMSHRKVFQVAIAAEKAAGRSFTGALIAGLVSLADMEEDIDPDDAKLIKDQLNAKMLGADHANDIAFVNRNLKFTPWTMTNADAQFHESRSFQVEEFARMLGLQPIHLSQTEKQTSWGSGIAEQNVGLARYTLMSYSSRFESAVKPLLPDDEFVEFDYKGFLQGSPKDEIGLLIDQKEAEILSPDEVRVILNIPGKAPKPEPVAIPTGGPIDG